MKKKQIIIILSLAMGLTLSACGDNNAEQTLSDNIIEEDSMENEVETEEETPEEIEQEEDESEENEITASDGTPEATNSEGLTTIEISRADGEYVESLGFLNELDWIAEAQAHGADTVSNAWWIYWAGQGAGDQPSYAINQRTGQRIEAGPNSFLYGTSLDDEYCEPFYGSEYTFPGDRYCEWQMNLKRSNGEAEEYLH